jgi:hypothetical protein
MLAAGPAWAETPGPCPVAPSVPTVDLGHYRGAWQVLQGDGTPLGDWQVCPPAKATGRENSWESCSFSLCGLADGPYVVRFSPVLGAHALNLNVQHGMLQLPATDLGMQNGNFGLDSSGASVPVMIDLAGYDGDWSIAQWPGPFHGMATGGRAEVVGGKLIFKLFPGVPYVFQFAAGRSGRLTAGANGGVAASDGGLFTVAGGVARLSGVAAP